MKIGKASFVSGSLSSKRVVVDYLATLSNYLQCDPSITTVESYLSIFTCYPEEREQFGAKNMIQVYHADYLVFDVDRNDLAQALDDSRTLAVSITDDFGVDPHDMLLFFSGNRGFHILVRTEAWEPPPDEHFPMQARLCCTGMAQKVGVVIDPIYDASRILRLPNTRHRKSGLCKIPLTLNELLTWSIDEIHECAKTTRSFSMPELDGRTNPTMGKLWSKCVEISLRKAVDTVTLKSQNSRIFQRTVDFIANGALESERNDRLFKAAANLADFSDRDSLIMGLLFEPAKKSGLPESEIIGTIESALRRKK